MLVTYIRENEVKMFFEASQFEFVSILETNWLLIKRELEQLQPSHFIPCPEKLLYNKSSCRIRHLSNQRI